MTTQRDTSAGERREAARHSRSDPGELGWGCEPGKFRKLLPPATTNLLGLRKGPRSNSWLRPSTLWRSRNHVIAHVLGDPAEEERADWMHQDREAEWLRQDPDRISDPDRDHATPVINLPPSDSVSFLVVGDTGEGDASQYATVPALEEHADTDFMVVCGDVIYPAGDTNEYVQKFYYPYKDYPRPIYAVPGNHDWYDNINGFMQHFCAAPPLRVRPRSGLRRRVRALLWRRSQLPDPLSVAAGLGLRPLEGQQPAGQTAPYWLLDTGPVQLIGIDTGIIGRIDGPQGQWLLDVSAASEKPKILITGKPLMVDAKIECCELVEPATDAHGKQYRTVDQIVGVPEHNYVAAIGGDIHNYQRYSARRRGRPFQYIVSGGGGAFMHATHRIGKLKPDELHGADEETFVCYPLRGDSLAVYSLVVGRWLPAGKRLLEIPRADAKLIMAKLIGVKKPDEEPVRLRRSRLRALFLRHMGGRIGQRLFSEIFDWNRPPMCKSLLRIEAWKTGVRVRCIAATGCVRHDGCAPVVDDFTIDL